MGKRKGGKEKGILQAESTGLFCLGSIFDSETTKKPDQHDIKCRLC